jgi:predicted GTPase
VVATKVESPEAESRAAELEVAVGAPVARISAWTGRGLGQLLVEAHRLVRGTRVG